MVDLEELDKLYSAALDSPYPVDLSALHNAYPALAAEIRELRQQAALVWVAAEVVESVRAMTGHAWDCDLTTWRRVKDMVGPAPDCNCGFREVLSALTTFDAAHDQQEKGT